jgi:hypothetical protein
MQFIKGGFSYRLRKELGCAGEVWQRGFSEVRVKRTFADIGNISRRIPCGRVWSLRETSLRGVSKR